MPNNQTMCYLMNKPEIGMLITNDIDFTECPQNGFVSLFLQTLKVENILIDNYIKLRSNSSFSGLIGTF
jgi:hypothetical protein